MSTESLADPLSPVAARPVGSLRLQLALGLPLVTAGVLLAIEWTLDSLDTSPEGLVRLAGLVVVISAAQWLLLEALLLRPLRQLAQGCEAMVAGAHTVGWSEPGEAGAVLSAELGRIGHAVEQTRTRLSQQDHEVRELRRELGQQRQLLQEAHGALEAQKRELASLARTDSLTGIANQRAFDEALRREFKRAQRLRGPLAVAVLDLDQFKEFNLVHGTDEGDAALQRVAGLLSDRFKRDTDVVARLGGEEFVALLPGVGVSEAQGVLELLRDELRALRLPDGRGDLTLSVGLAAFSPTHPYLSAQALLQAADEALYIAKHAGRDRMSLAA
ncbi:sensor domain-containing diguanylate cyclase [Roseateles sp. BYS87W]|uniref:diguanylate cyclase n=1 Tax=Pelomonas baiyunensis TaxID=3299026 RepID=A0ABW7H1P0_9BURK